MLTQRQEQFALNLVQDMSQREAYLKAGYSPKQLPATIDRHAHELANNDKIMARVSQLRQKAEDNAVMSLQERRKRLSEIAGANLTDFMELGQDGSWVNLGPETKKSGAIQEIHSRTEYDKDGSKPTVYTSVKLHDPVRAIDLLNKMDKLYSEGVTNNDIKTININEVKVVQFDPREVARAIAEALRLGISPEILGNNGHSQDASVLPPQSDIQAVIIPRSEN
jgi:phage terminase small subunit